jgi:hypothetical protein
VREEKDRRERREEDTNDKYGQSISRGRISRGPDAVKLDASGLVSYVGR